MTIHFLKSSYNNHQDYKILLLPHDLFFLRERRAWNKQHVSRSWILVIKSTIIKIQKWMKDLQVWSNLRSRLEMTSLEIPSSKKSWYEYLNVNEEKEYLNMTLALFLYEFRLLLKHKV